MGAGRGALVSTALVFAATFNGHSPALNSQVASTGVIAGRVLDGTSGQPISGALVRLDAVAAAVDLFGNPVEVIPSPSMSSSAAHSSVRTGTDGVFTFDSVRPGSFRILVERAGYLPGGYGYRRWNPPAVPVVLASGQTIRALAVSLWKPGVISGTARDETGDTLAGVEIRALRREAIGGQYRFSQTRSVRTDDQGRYRFDALNPGQYLLAAAACVITIPRAIAEPYQQARRNQPPDLPEVVSKSGAPVPSSNPAVTLGSIGALEWRGPVGTVASGATSDSPPQLDVYQTTFYSGANEPGAGLLLNVEPGIVLTNIDLDFRLSRSVQVAGDLRGATGPMAHTGLRLVPVSMDALASDRGFESAVTATDADGRFLFLGLPPGRYVLQAAIGTNVWVPPVNSPEALLTMTIDSARQLRAPQRPASDELLWARQILDVGDTNVRDVVLELRPGIRLDGRIEFDGASPRPARTAAVSMLLESVDKIREGAVAGSSPDADWRFRTAPYPPGRYRVIVGIGDDRWRLRSVTVGGRDVTFGSVDLGMTDVSDVVVTLDDRKRARISGQVLLTAGTSGTDLSARIPVVAFPADVEGWIASGMHPGRLQSAVATFGAPFSLSNLPPGDYVVATVPDGLSADFHDPAVIRAIAPGAERVHLEPGDNKNIVIQLKRTKTPGL